jgi:hypothetical protein
MTLKNTLGTFVVLAALVVLVPAARAEISPIIYHVEVCNEQGTACIGEDVIGVGAGSWQGGVYRWELLTQWDIPGTLGPVASFMPVSPEHPEGTSFTFIPAGQGRANPQVNVNFSVIGGAQPGQFTITSALVSFATVFNASGQVNVGLNLTDRSPLQADLTNSPGFVGKSTSWVNGLPTEPYLPSGFAGTGTLFRELYRTNLSTFGGSTGGTDQTSGFEPIGLDVSSISGQIKFNLSARDLASGSSTFVIMPEPASVLMVLGLALLRRR